MRRSRKNEAKVLLLMPRELKERLAEAAEQDNRTLSNYIVTVLMRTHQPN